MRAVQGQMGGGMMGGMGQQQGQGQAPRHVGMGSKPGAGSTSEAKAWKLFVGQVRVHGLRIKIFQGN